MNCVGYKLVDAHFAQTIAVEEERKLRDHLGADACAACHARYRRHLLLAKLSPSTARVDAEAVERIGHGLGFVSPPPSNKKTRDTKPSIVARLRPSQPVLAIAASLAMAAVLFLVLRRPSPTEMEGFRSRGVVSPMVPMDASPHISIFRITTRSEGSPALLSGPSPVIARGDELAFQYTNAARKTHLMIFGVDENRRVYWFYPAWTNENDNPTAVPIAPDSHEPFELREAIRHPFEGHRVTIHGLFLDRPMTVQEVETAVRTSETGEIMVPGAIDDAIMLEVSP